MVDAARIPGPGSRTWAGTAFNEVLQPMVATADAQNRDRSLLSNYSIEMTAKDVAHLEQAADVIPQGTKIPVTFHTDPETFHP
ncbi:MAG: hypothetical protein ABI885_15620, partial [Gammaproteobacteria bacterium]